MSEPKAVVRKKKTSAKRSAKERIAQRDSVDMFLAREVSTGKRPFGVNWFLVFVAGLLLVIMLLGAMVVAY